MRPCATSTRPSRPTARWGTRHGAVRSATRSRYCASSPTPLGVGASGRRTGGCRLRARPGGPDRVALGRKDDAGKWQDMTSAEFRDEVLALAKGLLAQGVRFGDRVAIMCPHPLRVDPLRLRAVDGRRPGRPHLPDLLGRAGLLDAARRRGVGVHGRARGPRDDHRLGHRPAAAAAAAVAAGRRARCDELFEAGAHIDDEVVHRHRRAVTPDSIATIIYTSGTTGRPKGCVITHANFMYEADTLIERWEPVFHSKPGDEAATLLFLPLAHVFGRMVQVAAIRGRVKFGHQPRAARPCAAARPRAFRPTFILAVPYIFEKVFNAARRKAEADGQDGAVREGRRGRGAVRGGAWSTGPSGSGPARRRACGMQHQFFEKVVYSKVRAAMGGRVRHAMSGGSAMDRRLGLFFEGAGVTIFEGYGLTESHRGRDRQPARAHPVRHGRPAHPGHDRAHRGGRRGLAARRHRSSPAISTTRRRRTPCCTTAGWPPATWAPWTRTAI